MPVHVQRDRRALVAKHVLDDLHVGLGSDGQRRGGVPQLVRSQSKTVEPGVANRLVEFLRSPIRRP